MLSHSHKAPQLHALDFNPRVSRQLAALAAEPAALPHILLYGPHGSGKRTRITALLHALYRQREPFDLKRTTLHLKIPPHKKNRGDNEIKATVVTSVHHVEIVLDQLAYHNVRDALQAILQYLSAGKLGTLGALPGQAVQQQYQCVVLYGVDQLPVQAQLALRRSMETLVNYCRFLMTATNTSKVNEALKSRCVCIRNPAPTTVVVRSLVPAISAQCGRNLTWARVLAEVQLSITEVLPWQRYTQHLVTLLQKAAKERKALPFQTLRKGLYELLSRGIKPEDMFNAVVDAAIDGSLSIPAPTLKRMVADLATAALDVTPLHEPIFYLESWLRRMHVLFLKQSESS